MENIEQFFQDSHYNIIRILLSISGLWPFHTRSRRYTIYIVVVLSGFLYVSGFIFELTGILEVKYNFFEMIDYLPLLFYITLAISRTLCMVHTLPKIKILLIKMQEYYLSPKSDEETKIQILHAQYGQKLGYAYTGFLLGTSVLYVVSTVLQTKLLYMESEETDETSNVQIIGLPYRIDFMIDLDTYYIPVIIHCIICDFVYTVLLVTNDVLYLTVVEYCCGLFEAVRYRLETALVFENNRLTIMSTKDKSYANIVYSIRRHTETLQFVAIVESIYSLPLFIQIGLTVILLSILGYQILNNMENISGIMNHAVYFNGLMLNLFFENWQGQKIVDSSEKVFASAYNTEWYNMPIAARKLLIMTMMRSEKPSTLKLCKIVVLSYITFNTVLRLSSSYFMLLRSL